MKHHRVTQIVASCAVFTLGTIVHGQTVVFDADFQGSTAETTPGSTSLFNSSSTVRNTILDAGTSIGSWDDNNSNVNTSYEISATAGGSNNVLMFSSQNNSITLADADFNQTVNLTGNELTVSWAWMHTDETGGGNGRAYLSLLDSSDEVIASVRWTDGGELLVAGTDLGNFKYELIGDRSVGSFAELSTTNWDPLLMELAVTSSGITVTTSGSNHTETTHATIAGNFSEVAGLRLRSSSNQSWSDGGMWIDDIHAEFSSVPEPSTAASFAGLLALASVVTRRRR